MKVCQIGGTDAGFFSMFRGTMCSCYYAESMDMVPYIDWRKTLYTDKQIKGNTWEYFFYNYYTPVEGDSVSRLNQHVLLPREYSTRLIINQMINKYAILKEFMQQNIDIAAKEFKEHMLGVHIRLTDKNNCTNHGEPESGKPIDIDLYEQHIDNYLRQHPEAGVFLATDDMMCVKRMKGTFGDRIVMQDALRSFGDNSIHHGIAGNQLKKGKDVILDCYLLSKCNHLIKGISNVALIAACINLDLTTENLNSIYKNDTREDFINV